MGGLAWVTLATNDSYSLGALVLAHSLKQAGTKQQLAVLITPGVTTAMREKLSTVFNVVQEVNILDSRDEANLRLLKRPELGITFTKLHCWRLTQFDKCVFLDADTLVLQNCDELFEREELSAAPDVGWPDCFNSGVFVYQPSNETYEKLITFALERGSFDGGDQGLLNLYFSDWAHKDISKHLPFIYNLCSTACYSYLPAFKQFGGNAKIIHFIGATKPWLQYFNTETKKVQPSGDSTHLTDVLQRWWDIFCSLIHPQLTPEMTRSGSDVVHIYGSPYIIPENYPQYPSHHHEHYPESSYHPTPADDYQNVWDPWDDYDFRQSQSQNVLNPNENQPFESLNTNAYSDAGHHEDSHQYHNDDDSHQYHHDEDSHQYHHDENIQPTPYIQYSQPQICVQQPSAQSHDNQQHSFVHHEPSHNHSFPRHSEPEIHDVPTSCHSEHVHQEWNEPVFHQPAAPEPHFHQPPPEPYFHRPPPEPYFHQPPPEHNFHQQPTQTYFHQESSGEQHSDIPQHSHDVVTDNHSQSFHEHRPSVDITPHTGSPGPSEEKTPENHTSHPQNDPDHYSQPILPIECEATSTVSNHISLHNSTYEDSSKDIEDAGLAGAFAQLTLGVARTPEQIALDDLLRRQAWELGNVDYLGRDSFDKIWCKIEETLSLGQEPVAEVAPEAAAELPKEPTTSSTASEVKTPQAQPEAIPDVIQETVTLAEESKKQEEQQTQRISTVAIPSPSLKESLEPVVVPSKTEPLPPIALPPPEDHTVVPETPKELPVTQPEVTAQEIPQASAVPEPVKPTPEQTVPTPEAAVPEPTVPTPEAVAPTPVQEPEKPTPEATPTPVVAQEPEKPTPVVVPQEPLKEVPSPAPQEPAVDLPKETAPLQTQAEVPVVEPQTVLSPPVSPVVDTQKPVEKVKPVPEPTKKSAVAIKPVEAVTEPTKTEPIASKPETPQPTTVQPEQKEVAPEVESCPRPTPKTEAVAPPPTEPVKTHKEGAKVKKVAKEASAEAAKAPPAAKVTEATPPTSPPVLPQLKQTKEALAVDTSIPDTPPPGSSEGATATPVPPPRKTTGGPKKPSSKTKK